MVAFKNTWYKSIFLVLILMVDIHLGFSRSKVGAVLSPSRKVSIFGFLAAAIEL